MKTSVGQISVDGVLLGALYATAWWAVQAPIFAVAPEMIGAAVAIDLIVTASVVHYFVGVRWAGLPAWTVSPVAIIGVLAAGMLAPNLESMGLVVALFAGVELLVGGVALLRSRTVVLEYRRAVTGGIDPLEALEHALEVATESKLLAGLVVSEIRLVSLGLVGVFRSSSETEDSFTCNREVGWTGLAAVLVFLSGVEIPIVHFGLDYVLGAWAAWPVTFASLYGVAWLWGDAQAMRLHPIELRTDVLDLRVGLRWRSSIPLGDIMAIERTTDAAEVDISLMSPNVRISLSKAASVVGLFGRTSSGTEISLRVDKPDVFIAAVQARDRRSHG